jgi:excisionase family DNA binding protein
MTKSKNAKQAEVERLTYTVAEFCAAMRISQTTYRKLRREGHGPAEMHVGKKPLITRAAAQAWMEAQQAEPK